MSESITNLPAVVAAHGALPMPVVPEPQALSVERLAEIAARVGIATEGPWRVVEGHEIHQGAEFGDFAVYVAQTDPDCGCVQSVADAEFIAHAREDVPALLADNGRLRARVAELEAERHVTNEALDDAVQELRRRETGPALPWAHAMSDHDLHGFLDDLVSAAMGRWRSEPEVPDRTVLADIERVCANWRTPGAGHRLDGSEFDGVTVRLAEPEPEFHGSLHHSYRLGHNLPETGGVVTRSAREDDDPARCLRVHPFSPRDGWRMVCGNCDHGKDAECHQVGA